MPQNLYDSLNRNQFSTQEGQKTRGYGTGAGFLRFVAKRRLGQYNPVGGFHMRTYRYNYRFSAALRNLFPGVVNSGVNIYPGSFRKDGYSPSGSAACLLGKPPSLRSWGLHCKDYHPESFMQEARFSCWRYHRPGTNENEHGLKQDLNSQVWTRMRQCLW